GGRNRPGCEASPKKLWAVGEKAMPLRESQAVARRAAGTSRAVIHMGRVRKRHSGLSLITYPLTSQCMTEWIALRSTKRFNALDRAVKARRIAGCRIWMRIVGDEESKL